jgi:hypothetical protein
MKVDRKLFFLTVIWISIFSQCKTTEPIKQEENVIQSNQSNSCPKSTEEFYQKFLFYEYDQIEKKPQLFADHYFASNERRIDLFYPYIKDKKGGYIGVGTDQNFTFIAWAKSDYAYLVDVDWMVVYVNRLHLLFFDASENFLEFKQYWSIRNKKNAIELIRNRITDTTEQKKYLQTYELARGMVWERLNDLEFMSKNFGFSSFHNNPDDFEYIKKMIQENRIYAVIGDINGNITLKNIGVASKNLCIPIHIVYLSNAEEYYRYPESFRNNIKNLNYDNQAIIVRTVTSGARKFGFPKGEKYPNIPFHYNIQPIENLIQWFQFDQLWIYEMMHYRDDLDVGISILKKSPNDLNIFVKKKP